MKKTSYIILSLIGAWVLIVSIGIKIISVNGRPSESSDSKYMVMGGATTMAELAPFNKVEFNSSVSLSTDEDENFRGVIVRQSDAYSVEYAECWGDKFTYAIEDSTLVITLNEPEDIGIRSVAGDPIIVRCPTITAITTEEYADMTVEKFDIPSLIASAPTTNLTDCRIGRLEHTSPQHSNICLKEYTVVDSLELTLGADVGLSSDYDGSCGIINVRSINGKNDLNIYDLDYEEINVYNDDEEKVEVYASHPYTMRPVKPE